LARTHTGPAGGKKNHAVMYRTVICESFDYCPFPMNSKASFVVSEVVPNHLSTHNSAVHVR
jgi:hypothetical protein